MKRAIVMSVFVSLCLLASSVLAATPVPIRGPQNCSIRATLPTTNTDGSPLSDLSSVKVYKKDQISPPTTYSESDLIATITSGIPPAPSANTNITWDCRNVGLSDGQHWVTVRAVDSAGNHSANAIPTPAAQLFGATQAAGVPFVYDSVPPAPATGME